MKTTLNIKIFLFLIFWGITNALNAQSFSHSTWNTLLSKYVSATGVVNYAGIKNENTQLESYLTSLGNGVSASASRNEKMAFWINAYNAFTVKLIIDNYPTQSIKNLKGGKPWDTKFISIAGKTYSLNDIEHNILRKEYFDARLHFVLVCAAKSCPKLLNKAYTAQNLSQEMDNQARIFINDASKNKITANKAQISELFNWYKDDFLKTEGVKNIQDYLNKFSTIKVNSKTSISYLTYNWSLNN